jgi:hypothetical protein
MFIINSGTEAVPNATEANAIEAAQRFVRELGIAGLSMHRNPKRDNVSDGIGGGRYAFILSLGDKSVNVEMPGCDPDVTERSKPFMSPRLYVNGSSWLWGFALDIARTTLIDDSD